MVTKALKANSTRQTKLEWPDKTLDGVNSSAIALPVPSQLNLNTKGLGEKLFFGKKIMSR